MYQQAFDFIVSFKLVYNRVIVAKIYAANIAEIQTTADFSSMATFKRPLKTHHFI
jgi:hypothetical protein